MSKLRTKVKQKRESFLRRGIDTGKRGKYSEAFTNENGAIDLASIMVGIIVIGLIGGVIAATVFAIIPWTQDNAAKHQLDSIVAAQSAYMGLSSDSPPALPTGHKANSFANSALLASANLLQAGSTYCTVVTDAGKSYQGLSQSSSGKVWSVTDKNTKPVSLGQGSIASDCSFTVGPVAEDGGATGDGSDTEVTYVDPTPTKTVMTYKCDVDTTGKMPLYNNSNLPLRGVETWVDNDPISPDITRTYAAGHTSTSADTLTLKAGVEYKLTFDGKFTNFSSFVGSFPDCMRSVDHWGSDTGTTLAENAFYKQKYLTDVPAHIPTTITSTHQMFHLATSFNDPDVSNWDVSNVTDMRSMFAHTTIFDQPLNDWNVSKAVNMRGMFQVAGKFNQPLDKWNVSTVTDMDYMFYNAKAFDQNISMWNVDKVTTYTQFASASPIVGKTAYLPKF